jgi:hypothetical protein
MMKLLEEANHMVSQANARAQKAEDQARILAGQLEEAQRQTVPSGGPSGAIGVLVPSSRKGKGREKAPSDAMDVFMPLVESRKGKEREEAPYDGGDENDENDPNEEEEV